MVLSSFSEVFTIGAILPFLSVLVDPEVVYSHTIAQPFVEYLEINSPKEIALPITLTFIAIVLTTGVIRLILLYITMRFSEALGMDLSINIYRRTLYQNYATHIEHNSSEAIDGIVTKINTVIGGVISPVMLLVSSVFIFVGIVFVLLTVNFEISIIAFIFSGLIYWMVHNYTHNRIHYNSKCIADKSIKIIKLLQESLGGIRDVLIDSSQEFYCNIYRKSDSSLRIARSNSLFIKSSPRYVIEILAMSSIASLAYFMSMEQQDNNDAIASFVPTIGAFTLGMQRLLPVIQQIYGSLIDIKMSHHSFENVINLLERPLLYNLNQQKNPIPFKNNITLKGVGFRYATDLDWIFKEINLELTKGERVGFIGKTGCGKSTLLDIIMGLLNSTTGKLMVDGLVVTAENIDAWQSHVAHVPQSIFLSDRTIEENIAFGEGKDDIDHGRVEQVAKLSQASIFIENLPNKYQTFVGEHGVRFSGGQCQRIGIARALYKQADVIILDEATSALDIETEAKIMDSMYELDSNLTVLIIAHRISTLKKCDRIVELGSGGILRIGKYRNFIDKGGSEIQ
jgi:ATP-binding cassette, subfamily B, bacterial PglK